MKNNILLFLCTDEEIERERKGYHDAFQSLGYEVVASGVIQKIKPFVDKFGERLYAILHPEGYKAIYPTDLLDYNIPTVIFQWDTYTRTKIRAFVSKIFDIKVVCHPEYVEKFEGFGCKNTYLLPHCVDGNLIGEKNKCEKKYDIGWVGRADAKFYSERRKILQYIKESGYSTNEIEKHYSWEEMIDVYKNSKIVVNISRDDYLQDANLRCFEAMGSGALLLTKLPTELEKIGFIDGVHFVGFNNLGHLQELILLYIKNHSQRLQISLNGRGFVQQAHTYLERAKALIGIIDEKGKAAIEQNEYRKLPRSVQLQKITFGYWKDGDLKKMLSCLRYSKKNARIIYLYLLAVRLYLNNLKRQMTS